MNFFQAIKTCYSKYAVFSGRASRAEFWYFFLVFAVQSVISSLLQNRLAIHGQPHSMIDWLWMAFELWGLSMALPYMAVSFRRLRDAGRSVWRYGANLIVVAATIVVSVEVIFRHSRDLLVIAGAGAGWVLAFLLGVINLILMAMPSRDAKSELGTFGALG